MKTCKECGERKSDRAFPVDGRTTDNLSHVCVECRFGDSANAMSEDETRTALRDFGLPSDVPADLLGGLVETARSFAQWTSSYVSGLPDSSFAYIEPGQEKDDDGKTTPRSARHFPYKDADGNLDAPHIRNALSRVEQWKTLSDGTDVSDSLRAKVRGKLQAALDSVSNDNADRQMGELETVTLERVPILSEGGPYYGTGSPPEGDYYTKDDLEEIAAANRALAQEVKASNKLGHSKEQRLLANSGLSVDEQPAAGWLPGNTFVVDQADDGKWKLYADIAKVPAKLAKLFEAGAFRTRSVELSRVTSQEQDGKVYETVVTGLAWLGAKAPAVRTLDDIYALYADVPDGEAREQIVKLLYADADELPSTVTRTIEYADGDPSATIIWQPETGFQDVINDLNAALNPTGGGDRRYWVSDVSTSLDRCIVSDWQSNATWIVPFTMNADGDPVPSPATEWTLAEQAWVESSDNLTERNFAAPLNSRPAPADTLVVPDLITDLTKLSDEAVVTLAKTFGFDGDDAATLRPQVEEHIKSFGGEKPKDDEKKIDPPADETERKMAELEARAALGERAYEERRVEKREELIQFGLRDPETGAARIQPAQVEDWRKFYDANPELATAQMKALPATETRIYGSDESVVGLPADVTPEDAKTAGDSAWAQYAAATGVPVEAGR